MRILFLILMGVLTANAQVPPLLRGPFTTNDPTGQLTLATNIALSVATNRIASSNANYVLKNNGTATGLLSVQNQTNSGTMDVLGIFTAYDGIYSQLGGVISGDTFNINSSSSLVVDGSSSLNGRVYVSGPATNRFLILAADTAVTNLPFGSIVAGPGIQLATNNGVLWVTNTGQTVPVNTNLYQIASSVLTNLSNNAGNTVTNATAQFVIASGTIAGASGASWTNLAAKEAVGGTVSPFSVQDTNGSTQFQIPTNRHGVVLLGTNANGITTLSNSPGRTTITTSNAAASQITQTSTGVGINTNAPATTLDVMGTAHIRDAMTNDTFITSLGGALVGGQLTVSGVGTFNNGLSVNNDTASINDGLNVIGGLAIQGLTGLKLLALDSGNNAISSAYYDTDIAAIIAGLGNTNLYLLMNAGKGTNNTFYSPTNQPQASNQVVATFQGVVGQTNNLAEFASNGVRQAYVKPSGSIIMPNGSAAAPSIGFAGSVNTGIYQSGNQLVFTRAGGDCGYFDTSSRLNLFATLLPTVTISFDIGLIGSMWRTCYVASIYGTNANFNGSVSVTGSFTNKSTIYAPTNTAPIVTGSNPTNSYTTGTVYFNLAQRSMLVGSAVLNGGVSGTANITLNYTNEGTGYQLPMQTGAGLATTDIFPFCVPLSTNASFQFVSTMGTGATGSLTNVVLWQH